jgi:glycosyltransferase involved in cell wall biosynthesis
MLPFNYITNLNVNEFSGGWSGMNHFVHDQLKRKFDANLVEGVNPSYKLTERIQSKVARSLGLKGLFPAFSKSRLKVINDIVSSRLNPDARFNFYHGATSWLQVKSKLPYACYLDACFATYLNIYQNERDFSAKQISNLYKQEAEFLKSAAAVFFSSEWSKYDTLQRYKLNGDNFYVAGLGGGLNAVAAKKSNEKYFLFVGLDFFGKGGDKVVNAFRNISKQYPQFSLRIVGEKPPSIFLDNDKINYLGFFDKSDSQQQQQLLSLFTNAYAFVMPTAKDMTPLVLIEAGSVGCPVISTNNYGISEIVKNEKTGLLIENDLDINESLQNAMLRLIRDVQLRDQMSNNAATHIAENFSWEKTGEIISATILTKI